MEEVIAPWHGACDKSRPRDFVESPPRRERNAYGIEGSSSDVETAVSDLGGGSGGGDIAPLQAFRPCAAVIFGRGRFRRKARRADPSDRAKPAPRDAGGPRRSSPLCCHLPV